MAYSVVLLEQEQVKQSGKFDPGAITGRMTLEEVSRVSGTPEEAFQKRFNLRKSDMAIPLKELGPPRGFETDNVRTFVSEYPGEK